MAQYYRTWSDPQAATASAQGLDVSDYQGAYAWPVAKQRVAGLAFGTYRATQGLGGPGTVSPDPQAEHNHEAIAAAGLARGAYHFLDPELDGAKQADYFLTYLGQLGLGQSDMLWLDTETAGPTAAATAECGQAFMAELDRLAPHNPRGVYTYISFADAGNCDGLGAYPLWLAWPGLPAPAPPPPWRTWTFWQWGQRNGTDCDAFNGSAAALEAWVASYAVPPPSRGPYRHTADGKTLAGQLTADRNTSAAHILGVTASAWTKSDEQAVARLALPAGWPYYTTNP